LSQPTTLNVSSGPALRFDATSGTLRERRYRVSVRKGPDAGKELALDGLILVGTGDTVDFKLTDPTVSRKHLEIEPRSDGVRLRDLQSRNGSYAAGAKLGEVLLEVTRHAGVTVGHTELEISAVDRRVEASGSVTRLGNVESDAPAMRRVLGILKAVAPSTATVLLLGETGTGKSVLAEAVHKASDRRTAGLVVVDCGAVSAPLIESELFGHVRGAFTGAATARKGAFLLADGGTLFLDEVGELPLELQPKLLRALECGQVKRVGDDVEHRVDVRVVAATNRDLEAEVQAGRFRRDLFYRLAVVPVHVPALRERPEDIALLTRHFLEEIGGAGVELSDTLLGSFRAQAWPGNVRELRNVVQRIHLGAELELDRPTPKGRRTSSTDLPFKDAKEKLFESFVREYLGGLLAECKGNVSQVARRAKIDRNYVMRLMERYAVESHRG
jgi:two-component system response regulator GlrR